MGNRAVWFWFDSNGEQPASRRGEAFKAIVKSGQRPSAAVAQSLRRKLGSDVQLWPVDRSFGSETFRAQWFDSQRETYHEGSVEIMRMGGTR